MTQSWEFKKSFYVAIGREFAWEFLVDMQNVAKIEKVTIELDGPFQSGTKGRTITPDSRQEWEIIDVVPLECFTILGRESEFEMRFTWELKEEGRGTRMIQTIHACGPEAEMSKWEGVLREMETNVPKSHENMVAELTRRANASK